MRARLRHLQRIVLALALIGLLPLAVLAATPPCHSISGAACTGAPCCDLGSNSRAAGCRIPGCPATPATLPATTATRAEMLPRQGDLHAWRFTVRTCAPSPATPPPRPVPSR